MLNIVSDNKYVVNNAHHNIVPGRVAGSCRPGPAAARTRPAAAHAYANGYLTDYDGTGYQTHRGYD
jgi:hypothetical protein